MLIPFVGIDLSPVEKYLGLLLRIGIGFIWIWMAVVPKLILPERGTMMTKMASWLIPFSIPLPILTKGIAMLELALGVLLILGLFTRFVSLLMIFMLAAIFIGLWPYVPQKGITSPLAHLLLKDVPLAAATFYLFVKGGGQYSLDARLGRA
ncbi:MAG: DoxX family protein [Candidatus Methylomirabilales bacterium]